MAAIKICGLTRPCDIDFVNELKPEYIGFVFAPSKRQVSVSQAKELIQQVSYSQCVGVFVNETPQRICQIATQSDLDIIQLHGDETQEDIDYIKANSLCLVWKALRLRNQNDLNQLNQLHPDRFLLDSFHEDAYGGSGKRMDERLLQNVNTKELILAGGIDIHNVKELLAYHPFAIDVSSGVETNHVKDYGKIKQLIREVRT